MNVEIKKVYHPETNREIHNTREIEVWGNTYNFTILIGIGNRQSINQPISNIMMTSSIRQLYTASIAVVMDILGNMRIVKNCWGCDQHRLSNLEVRQEILSSLESVGLNNYEQHLVLGNFNQAISDILDEPVITSVIYPLGINYRDYMRRGVMVKDYKVKKHCMI
jgi:hypothetical protein